MEAFGLTLPEALLLRRVDPVTYSPAFSLGLRHSSALRIGCASSHWAYIYMALRVHTVPRGTIRPASWRAMSLAQFPWCATNSSRRLPTVDEVVETHSSEETIQWGREFAARLMPPLLVLLSGDLGSGK